MYAIIKTGGKQYRVSEGDKLKVETLPGDAGDNYQFDDVLMVADGESVQIGAPMVEGAAVASTIVTHGRHKKVEIIKFKRRKHHQKRTGHRQNYTLVEISSIIASGATASEDSKQAKTAAPKKAATPAKQEKAVASDTSTDVDMPTFLAEPQGEPDDLKKIKGVGPVLEGKLHKMGIFHFHQVAAFTAEDISKIDTFLNFKGRIDRDDWMSQAKALADEK